MAKQTILICDRPHPSTEGVVAAVEHVTYRSLQHGHGAFDFCAPHTKEFFAAMASTSNGHRTASQGILNARVIRDGKEFRAQLAKWARKPITRTELLAHIRRAYPTLKEPAACYHIQLLLRQKTLTSVGIGKYVARSK